MTLRGRAGVDSNGGQGYSAASMSLVFHTASPLVPTFRADVRYFEVLTRTRISDNSMHLYKTTQHSTAQQALYPPQ